MTETNKSELETLKAQLAQANTELRTLDLKLTDKAISLRESESQVRELREALQRARNVIQEALAIDKAALRSARPKPCETCRGRGEILTQGPCYMNCYVCSGSGYPPCPQCGSKFHIQCAPPSPAREKEMSE